MKSISILEYEDAIIPIGGGLYASPEWKIGKDRDIVGLRALFHKTQSSPSYMGGAIVAAPRTDSGRVVIIFRADESSVGIECQGEWGYRAEKRYWEAA